MRSIRMMLAVIVGVCVLAPSARVGAQPAPAADLAVTKSAPATALAGANISYTLALTNNGPDEAANVALSDTVPAGATFVSLVQDTGPAATSTTPVVGGTGTVTATWVNVAAAATATFTLTVNTNASFTGSLVNTATVSSVTSDGDPSNNSSTATTAVTAEADLATTKTGPATATPGANVSYTLTATNTGPSDAANVVLSDGLVAGVTFVSLVQDSGPAATMTTPAVGGTGMVTATWATLAAGATATFTLTVNVGGGVAGNLLNSAVISSATTDPNPANNTSTAQLVVAPTTTTTTTTTTSTTTSTSIPGTTTTTIAGVIPATGSDTSDLAVAVVVMLAAGLALVAIARRSRHQQAAD